MKAVTCPVPLFFGIRHVQPIDSGQTKLHDRYPGAALGLTRQRYSEYGRVQQDRRPFTSTGTVFKRSSIGIFRRSQTGGMLSRQERNPGGVRHARTDAISR